MHPAIAVIPVSEHEWIVADDDAVLGVVEEHSGDYEASLAGGSAWHPHFDSLSAATLYFSEYSSALQLGLD